MAASEQQTVQTVRFTREMQSAAWHFLGNLPGGRGSQLSMHDIELMFHAMRKTLPSIPAPGPAGEADDLIERLLKKTALNLNDAKAVRAYLEADSILHHDVASALAAYQAKVGELERQLAERS